jgi:hypothetical protein
MRRAYNISAGVDMALARRALALIQRHNLNVVTASNVRRGLNIDMDTAQETVQTLIFAPCFTLSAERRGASCIWKRQTR